MDLLLNYSVLPVEMQQSSVEMYHKRAICFLGVYNIVTKQTFQLIGDHYD